MQKASSLQERLNRAFAGERFIFEPAELYQPIDYILALGGKRLRPLLVLLSCDMFDGDIEEAIYPAIGLELFHNFTLIHDDIMDNASLRRGQETIWKRWNSNVAILSGDTMFVMAYQYVTRTKESALSMVLDLFSDTARKVCEGQQLDMNFESRDDVTIPEYIEMIRLKTAVLIACSLKLGALLSCGDNEEAKKMYDFGISLGLAFQLQDDFLDTFGDESVFGKEIGGDIHANKKTFLLLKAMELADDATRARLTACYNDRSVKSEEKVREVKKIFRELGIESKTREVIDHYFNKGMESLRMVDIPEKKKTELKKVALGLVNRQS